MDIDLIDTIFEDDISKLRLLLLNLLLDRGINPNDQDSEGKTLLMKIVSTYDNNNFNPYPMTQILLDSGAEMDIKDNDGNTALIYATIQENNGIVKLLLDRGANPLIKNNSNDRFDDYLREYVIPRFSPYIKDYQTKIAEQRLAYMSGLQLRLGADTPLNLLDQGVIDRMTEEIADKDCVDLPDKNDEKWKEPIAPYNDCEAYERHPEWCKLRGDARKHCCACNGGKTFIKTQQTGKGKRYRRKSNRKGK